MKLRLAWVWGSAIGLLLLTGGVAAAQDAGNQEPSLWLPYAASDYSYKVDLLYKVIFWVTTGMFILTEGLLIAFCFLYRRRPGHKPHYTHGSNVAEITWTVIPALMLLVLAIVQIGPWNEIKKPDWAKMEKDPDVTVVDVLGQQFKWNIRYPGSAAWYNKIKDKDDDEVKNDHTNLSNLHIPFGNRALLNLRSSDVIHSVFIPHMRVKQDTVPGLRQRIWFKPNRIQVINLDPAKVKKQSYKTLRGEDYFEQEYQWANDPSEFEKGGKFALLKIALSKYVQKENGLYQALNPSAKVRMLHQGEVTEAPWSECNAAIGIFEIACAELCGAEHYTMRAFLTVDPTKKAYEAWLRSETSDDVDAPSIWKAWQK